MHFSKMSLIEWVGASSFFLSVGSLEFISSKRIFLQQFLEVSLIDLKS